LPGVSRIGINVRHIRRSASLSCDRPVTPIKVHARVKYPRIAPFRAW
jgi:hypothetical protein